ncbi:MULTISPECIES: hypothetical protein [unclassified Brevibacillus]|uniref:hypothetical protein n=1 Tax=unclassified Brevibacillus TaxID=2684853 RepID=UPI00356183A7
MGKTRYFAAGEICGCGSEHIYRVDIVSAENDRTFDQLKESIPDLLHELNSQEDLIEALLDVQFAMMENIEDLEREAGANLRQLHIERGIGAINDPESGWTLYGALEKIAGEGIVPIFVWADDLEEAAELLTEETEDWDWLAPVDSNGHFVQF